MSVMWLIVLHPYTKSEVRSPSHSEDMTDFRGTSLIGLVTLTFDLSTSKYGSRVTRVMGFLPANFYPATPFYCRLY